MVMLEQSKRLSEPLRWGRREKTAVAALLGVRRCSRVIALGAYALTSGAPARADCIEVTFASTLGGAEAARLRRAGPHDLRLRRASRASPTQLREPCAARRLRRTARPAEPR